MRADILFNKKSVHIKLDKEIHHTLREKLLKYDITMQDFFHDAAELILVESQRSENILQKLVKKKLLSSIENSKNKKDSFSDIVDNDLLYSLLEESIETK